MKATRAFLLLLMAVVILGIVPTMGAVAIDVAFEPATLTDVKPAEMIDDDAGCTDDVALEPATLIDVKPIEIIYDDAGYTDLGAHLYQYFSDFYSILETGEIEDLEVAQKDANTYILFQLNKHTHDFYETYYDGINDVVISQFTIKEVTHYEDYTEVIVYVAVRYNFDGEDSGRGGLYRVKLIDNEVSVIDATAIEAQMIKDTLLIEKSKQMSSNVRNSRDVVLSDIELLDEIFEEKTESLAAAYELFLETKNSSNMQQNIDVSDSDDVLEVASSTSTASTSVSFSASDARYYGFWFGDHYENYIFNRASLDCTNFVSQCIWSGYGGTLGYSITDIGSLATANNATAIALRARVVSNTFILLRALGITP
jgi:hypothetical protein